MSLDATLVMGMQRPLRTGQCKYPGCTQTFTSPSKQRRYCDVHSFHLHYKGKTQYPVRRNPCPSTP